MKQPPALILAHSLCGKTVGRVDMNPFDDGRGGVAYQPIITMTDGTRISFIAQETECCGYGVLPILMEIPT